MLEKTLAREVMHGPVKNLSAGMPVNEAARFLLDWGISGAPVVDEKGRWAGVFSLSDIARHVQDRLVGSAGTDPKAARSLERREPAPRSYPLEGFEDARVVDLMTFGIYTVFPDAKLEEVVRTLVTQKVHRVFVIDGSELKGVITTMDVMRWLEAAKREIPVEKS